MATYLFFYLGRDGQLSVFLLGEGGHVFVFFFGGEGLPPFFLFFAMDGHPSIVLFGRGSLLLFYLEGLATYLFFIFCFFLGGWG